VLPEAGRTELAGISSASRQIQAHAVHGRLGAVAGLPAIRAPQPRRTASCRTDRLPASPELWTARFEEADRHLEDGIVLARQLGRPYLEVTGLAYWAQLVSWRSFPLGAQRSMQAIELAGRHGWTEEPVAGVAYLALGGGHDRPGAVR
jgi:hypothetical protein